MIGRCTCLWGPKVVGLVRVEGKHFGKIGQIVRYPGYRELWSYVDRKLDEGRTYFSEMRRNWGERQSIEHREQHPLCK